jgi:hypothetical protein
MRSAPDGGPGVISRVLGWIGSVGLLVGAISVTVLVSGGTGDPAILILVWPLFLVFGGAFLLREFATRKKP